MNDQAPADTLARCPWPKADPLYIAYHDQDLYAPEVDALRAGFDAQIEELTREKDAAVAQADTQRATRLNSEIESLNRQREGIIRGRQGGPQEW